MLKTVNFMSSGPSLALITPTAIPQGDLLFNYLADLSLHLVVFLISRGLGTVPTLVGVDQLFRVNIYLLEPVCRPDLVRSDRKNLIGYRLQ